LADSLNPFETQVDEILHLGNLGFEPLEVVHHAEYQRVLVLMRGIPVVVDGPVVRLLAVECAAEQSSSWRVHSCRQWVNGRGAGDGQSASGGLLWIVIIRGGAGCS